MGEVYAQIISAGALCTAVMSIISLIIALKKPSDNRKEKIEELEKRIDSLEKKVSNDSDALENQQEINSLMLQSLGALLAHGIDGNNTAEMENCRNKINERLYSSGGSIR